MAAFDAVADVLDTCRLLGELSTDALLLVRDGEIGWASPRAAALLGYDTADALRGQPARSLVAPVSQDTLDALLSTDARADADDTHTVLTCRADGGTFAATLRVQPLPNDAACRLVALADDTERVDADRVARNSERTYRAIFDSAFQFMALLEPDGTIIEINRTALDFFRLDRAEVAGRPLADVFAPMLTAGDAERLREAIRTAERGAFARFETRASVDGTEVYVDVSMKPVFGEGDVPVEIIAEGRDVTERAQAESARRQSEAHARAILHALPDALARLDRDGTYLDVHVPEGYGTIEDPEELVGQSVYDVLPADIAEQVRTCIDEALRTLDLQRFEYTFEIGGVNRTREARIVPYGLDEVLAFQRDITERKQAENALRASETRLARAQEICHIGSWEWHIEDGTLIWSDEMYRIYGLQPGGPIDYERYLSLQHPDDRAKATAAIEASRASGEPFSFYHRIVRPGGEVRTLRGEGIALTDAEGTVVGMTGTGHDVTDQVAAERTLERTNEELRRRNEELQQFAYAASHDLQEPLRKISSFADLLAGDYTDQLDDEGRFFIDRIQDASNRLSTLIRDLLAFSRVATRFDDLQAVDLDDVLDDVLLDLEFSIREADATIHRTALPEVQADPTQMRQLLQNLVGNALKFRADDRDPVLHIRASTVVRDDRRWCRLEVEDNGIGFNEKYMDKVFAPFQRLHGRNVYAGTGMGLAICRRITERHGGSLTATSVPGEGTTFIAILPLATPETTDA